MLSGRENKVSHQRNVTPNFLRFKSTASDMQRSRCLRARARRNRRSQRTRVRGAHRGPAGRASMSTKSGCCTSASSVTSQPLREHPNDQIEIASRGRPEAQGNARSRPAAQARIIGAQELQQQQEHQAQGQHQPGQAAEELQPKTQRIVALKVRRAGEAAEQGADPHANAAAVRAQLHQQAEGQEAVAEGEGQAEEEVHERGLRHKGRGGAELLPDI